MHKQLRKNANSAGFHESDGSLLILSCGAEETDTILEHLDVLSRRPRSQSPIAKPFTKEEPLRARNTTQSARRPSSPPNPNFAPQVDTIISVLTLCTIPSTHGNTPESAIASLVQRVLKPGGQLLYYEHTLHPTRSDVAFWQRKWAPVWACFFDGCRMDRASDVWVKEIQSEEGQETIWREAKVWDKPGEEEETLFRHSVGRYVKK